MTIKKLKKTWCWIFITIKSLKMEAENQLFFNSCLVSSISPENALGLLRCDENVANDVNPLVLIVLLLGIVANNGFHVCTQQLTFLMKVCNGKLSDADRMRVLVEFEKSYEGNEYLAMLREKVNQDMKMKKGVRGC